MPRVSSFMVPADDLARAAGFYREVLGWRVEEDESPEARGLVWHLHAEPERSGDVQGVLTPREFPGQPIGIGIEVPAIDEFTDRVEQHGGKVLVRKGAIPGVAWFSVCQDSEGNTFILSQPDPSA